MIAVLPSTCSAIERLKLAKAHELSFGCLGEKTTPLAAAYERIYLFDKLLRNDDVCALAIHLEEVKEI
jgi:hypothetical protein